MVQYIDKDALVAELKKRVSDYWSDSENTMGIYPYALEEVIKYVDTVEVKEVVEVEVTETCGIPSIWMKMPNNKRGDKVKLIIVEDRPMTQEQAQAIYDDGYKHGQDDMDARFRN